jgi:membrane-associated protein
LAIVSISAGTLPLAIVHTLGPQWMQPTYWLDKFSGAAFIAVLVIVFIECGLFVFFLPGDSLLFVTGLYISTGTIGVPLWLACILLSIAAVGGNIVGYLIGRRIGPSLFDKPDSRFFKPQYIQSTHDFFTKYGPKAIVMARFVPVVRTFITAMAGVGNMNQRMYTSYSVIGGVLWASGLTILGYFLGHIQFVQKNIDLIAIAIVIVSVMPAVLEWQRNRKSAEPHL